MHTSPPQQDFVWLPSSGTRVRRAGCLAISIFTVLALSGCERYALDHKMEELCKKDGGIKVYETVTLPASEFSTTGEPLARYIPLAKGVDDYLGPDYRYVRDIDVLVGKDADTEKGAGRLTRVYYAIYRRADQRLLGEAVSYGRGGGDGVTFGFQPSGDYCPKPRPDLISSVFKRGA